ncbi:MAG TPA: TorF family putative porin, partial [Phenylobacterium sp.]
MAGAEGAGVCLRTLGVAATAAVLGLPNPVLAQVSGSVSVVSDYRLRAASMSDRQPAVTLTLTDDLANGVYFGATAVAGEPRNAETQVLGHIEFVGFAHRAANGLTWEVGADNVDFDLYPEPNFHLSYSEAYAGFSNGTFSSRLYISPNYLKEGLTAGYLEVNGVARPS